MTRRLALGTALALALAAPVAAGWVVDLSSGEHLVADDYWLEGDQAHLVQGGSTMVVPASQIARAREDLAGGAGRAAGPSAAAAARSLDDLESDERRVANHLLRIQRERFVAQHRGDDAKSLRRIEREFLRTQRRWRTADDAVKAARGE